MTRDGDHSQEESTEKTAPPPETSSLTIMKLPRNVFCAFKFVSYRRPGGSGALLWCDPVVGNWSSQELLVGHRVSILEPSVCCAVSSLFVNNSWDFVIFSATRQILKFIATGSPSHTAFR